MNTRPTRAPAPPLAETFGGGHTSTYSTHPENNLPAEIGPGTSSPVPSAETHPALPSTGFSNLAAAIANVMAEIKPVEKTGWNDFHKYNYARMQDLSAELTPLMGRNGVVIFQNELNRDIFDEGRAMAVRYQFTIVHKSGEIWPERPVITGVSMCRTTNGKYDDKAFNKCHTSARKYFLLSLFQIPTDDIGDADGDSGGNGEARKRPQPQAKRPAPAPDGKMQPHTITIIDGEQPEAWAKRFNAFIDKSDTTAEVDKWYDANIGVFDKIKGRFQSVYDDLIDYMDARAAKLGGATAEPISSGAPVSDFPGDSKPSGDGLDIPPALRRAPPSITDEERDWLMGLEGSFSGCEDQDSLSIEYERLMAKYQGKVSTAAWDRAVVIHDENIERIERDI